jgi:proton-dependent oligopeptide transporter, POT family
MSSGAELDTVEAVKANISAIEKGVVGDKAADTISASASSAASNALFGPNGERYPTKEELETLPRVVGKVDWIIYSIAFIELCERFGYYGTTAVC